MTFTELEYLLMLAVAILLWRNAKLDAAKDDAVYEANKYASFLHRIGQGKGTVKADGTGYRYEDLK